MHLREERLTKPKGCPHLYEGDTEEDEVIAAMCDSGETYNSIQINREDDEYSQHIKPVKGSSGTKSFPLDSKLFHVYIWCK